MGVRRDGTGTSIAVYVATEGRVSNGNEPIGAWDRMLRIEISSAWTSVLCDDWAEDPDGVTIGVIDLGVFKWDQARFYSTAAPGQHAVWRARVANWFPLAVLVAYPTLTFIRGPMRRWRRWRRKERGLCLTCGYNLQGNVSGVCPECGTEITP